MSKGHYCPKCGKNHYVNPDLYHEVIKLREKVAELEDGRKLKFRLPKGYLDEDEDEE